MPASSSTITVALGESVAELLDVDQRPIDRARRDPGLVGELARAAAGRREPDHPVARTLS